MSLAERLAHAVHPEPSPAFIASLASDAELMAIAATDLDAAAQTLLQYAIDTVTAYVTATAEHAAQDAA